MEILLLEKNSVIVYINLFTHEHKAKASMDHGLIDQYYLLFFFFLAF